MFTFALLLFKKLTLVFLQVNDNSASDCYQNLPLTQGTMVSEFTLGTLLAFGAALSFGTHSSFAKVKSVRDSKVAVSIYNIYFLFGGAIVCFIEYFIMIGIGEHVEFTYLGILSAIALLFVETFIVLAVQQIGVGYATGFTVFPASVLTPIVHLILGQHIASVWIMIIGLCITALTAFTMSIFRDIVHHFGLTQHDMTPSSKCSKNDNPQKPDLKNVRSDSGTSGTKAIDSTDIEMDIRSQQSEQTSSASHSGSSESSTITHRQMLLGLLFSTCAAVFLPLVPLPSLYASEDSMGLKFFLSFGIGCFIVIPFNAFNVVLTEKGKTLKNAKTTSMDTQSDGEQDVTPHSVLYPVFTFSDDVWHFKEVMFPAMMGGIVWSIGNICGILSLLYLTFTIHVSFLQCQLMVTMLLSIVVWREFTTPIEICSILCLFVMMAGGCLVVVYGVWGSLS